MSAPASTKIRVVVASTVMLSFISFWRAAAIVLSDLASSAYYAGGIAESSIGKPAPWFILAVMLFGFAICAIYIESSSMFVRGGVYRVVQEALGGTLAKLSVSALMFDYVLTGPISGVSAGLYLAGLLDDATRHLRHPVHVPASYVAVGFAMSATTYFWAQNRIGLRESSAKALRIMQITTVMVVILIIWCLVTIAQHGFQPVPLPTKTNLHLSPEALGWLAGTAAPNITLIVWLIGLGHSLLAMSGFETLAQVYRDIEAPKLKNLKRTGLVTIVYSLIFTSSVSFFAVMLIPDRVRVRYLDNLIGGLAMHLAGPRILTILFHIFVVLVGTLILSGAVNTAIVGANGVLNRIAEDRILPDWFRRPHPKYGTTSRILNLIFVLQILTILLSRGNVIVLGEAYAFGVVWSFAMKALGVLVLRYKRPHEREWKVPLNFRIGTVEIPLGLIVITATLFSLAVINVLTKKTATIAGSLFTAVFFTVFVVSERRNQMRQRKGAAEAEKFRLEEASDLSLDAVRVRPGNVLIEVCYPDRLEHVERVLNELDPARQDAVAVVVHLLSPFSSGEHPLKPEQICSDREIEVLTRVVSIAEKAGKHIELTVVPGTNRSWVLVQTAQKLKSERIIERALPRVSPEEQARELGRAWEQLPEPRPDLIVEVIPGREGPPMIFHLGPHAPTLQPADIELVHRLWLELTDEFGFGPQLHHRDVVAAALRRFDKELHSPNQRDVLEDVRRELTEKSGLRPVP